MPLRRKATAAVEMTALAAGAGPPANKIATRLKLVSCLSGLARADETDLGMENLRRPNQKRITGFHFMIQWSLSQDVSSPLRRCKGMILYHNSRSSYF